MTYSDEFIALAFRANVSFTELAILLDMDPADVKAAVNRIPTGTESAELLAGIVR